VMGKRRKDNASPYAGRKKCPKGGESDLPEAYVFMMKKTICIRRLRQP